MTRALILTYHAVERGPAPLCVDPALFAEHASVISESGVLSLTVRDLAAALRTRSLERDAVVITFDDGYTNVVDNAVPTLVDRGLTATVFCVAGYLGRASDWPSARDGGYRSPLASASALRELEPAGFELGSHGIEHAPLAGAAASLVRREVVDSKRMLEDALGTEVSSFAYPYGALPGQDGRMLVRETYEAACMTLLARVTGNSDVHALARVDAHYLRNPDYLRRVLSGRLDGYLKARRAAARAKRIFVKDYAPHPAATEGA